MAWSDWTGRSWKVKTVDHSKIPVGEIEVDDILRFAGSGVKTDPASVVTRRRAGTTVTWATECDWTTGTPEEVSVKHATLGKFIIYRSPGAPAKLDCQKGGPTGSVWTAEDQGAP